MRFWTRWMGRMILLLCLHVALGGRGADSFRIATYNLDNYFLHAVGSRPVKLPEARAKIREGLRALNAEVVALQEVGGLAALDELRGSLKKEGLDYPHWEWITGFDTNIQIAVLSRFPIVARHPHTNDSFLLLGRRFRVSRGFLEVDIQVTPAYRFTLFTAHLKSRRQVAFADEALFREQEALILREKIDQRLQANPKANLVVLGDLNDVKSESPIRILLGRGRNALQDLRPAERNGDSVPASNPNYDPPHITWTHFYGKEDSYSRIDYILVSPGMAREWNAGETYVLALPNWGLASDHRPITAVFSTREH